MTENRKDISLQQNLSILNKLEIHNDFLALGQYSQHFIFVTCEWAHEARVLHYTLLEILAKDNYSRLLGPFICDMCNE